ncbi:hypothetical protein [Rubripirellula lacrimiformis]|nr:hypothetical protein [Rubripirellula lacrimiformis]
MKTACNRIHLSWLSSIDLAPCIALMTDTQVPSDHAIAAFMPRSWRNACRTFLFPLILLVSAVHLVPPECTASHCFETQADQGVDHSVSSVDMALTSCLTANGSGPSFDFRPQPSKQPGVCFAGASPTSLQRLRQTLGCGLPVWASCDSTTLVNLQVRLQI